jgi:hypothetical protein
MRAFGLVTSHWCRLGSGQSVSQLFRAHPAFHTHSRFPGMIHDSGTRTDDDFLKEPHIYTP